MAAKIPVPPKRELIKHHAAGKNYTDISRMCDVSRSTVKNWFKLYELYSPPGRRKVATPARDTLDKQIVGGMGNEALAGFYQVHVTTISLWLRGYGLKSVKARRYVETKRKPQSVMPKLNMPANQNAPQFIP